MFNGNIMLNIEKCFLCLEEKPANMFIVIHDKHKICTDCNELKKFESCPLCRETKNLYKNDKDEYLKRIDEHLHKINLSQRKYYWNHPTNRYISPSHQISAVYYNTIKYVEEETILIENITDKTIKKQLLYKLNYLLIRIKQIIKNDESNLLSIDKVNKINKKVEDDRQAFCLSRCNE
jgi:hypothetical protein